MKALISTVATILVLAGCVEEQQPNDALPVDTGVGKLIAAEACDACHGPDGRGMAPGIPHLAGQPFEYILNSLQQYQDGSRIHVALHDLTSGMSEQDLRNLAAWFSSLPRLTVAGASHAEKTLYEQGEEIAKACSGCHGDAGNSTTPGVPALAGQQPLYFIAATQAYLQGAREMSGMEESLRGIRKPDIEKLALYYASQTPEPRQAPDFGTPELGEALSAKCSGCHGSRGISTDAATPNLAGQDPQYLMKASKAYRGNVRHHDVMFAEKRDSDLESIVAYYASQASKPAEKEIFSAENLAQNCDRCHAPGASVKNMVIPNLNGQDRDYLIMALRAYRDDNRESSMMHKMSLPYSDSVIENIADLYAGRVPRE